MKRFSYRDSTGRRARGGKEKNKEKTRSSLVSVCLRAGFVL